jgi:hypothetical protein
MADTLSVTEFSTLRLPGAHFLRSQSEKPLGGISEWKMVVQFCLVNCLIWQWSKTT